MSEFNCTSCGLCCANIGRIVDHANALCVDGNIEPLVNEVAKFPFKYDKSGRCEKLGADNKCMVYETRPDVCVVDKMWEKHTHFISKEQYHKIAESHCKTLQDGL